MKVYPAAISDYEKWIDFVKRVMPIFGINLSTDENYLNAVRKNMKRRTAFCVKANDDEDGRIIGGMLFSSSKKPLYKIGWFAVDSSFMNKGIGTSIFKHIEPMIEPPAELIVETFSAKYDCGTSARNFYTRMGMEAAEILTGDFPHGDECQVYRKYYVTPLHSKTEKSL